MPRSQKTKKRKAKSLKKRLEDKLWEVFSIWVRSKDADKNGKVLCYTCGTKINWKYEAEAGHFIKRQHQATKYDERNVKPQCSRCNHYLDGAQDEFAAHIVIDYGAETLKELLRLKQTIRRWTSPELAALIKKYESKLKLLNKL
jgi:DNA-directed RNA polymerase subunit N (RpoN/RPB10)